MAGLGSLDSLYQTFLGQTNEAMNEPPAPWQQELMETVNPQKVRAQNIKRALAQASMSLATTPGNFLTGLSAAAGTGANAYLTAQDDSEQQRMRAMQLVQVAQQKDKDRRLSLLQDALGVGRNLQSDKIAEEDRQYRRGRDAKQDERQTRLDDSLIESRNRSLGGSGSEAAIERRRGQAADTYFRQLDKLRSDNTHLGEEPSEEEKDMLWNEIQKRFRLDDDGSGAPADEGAPAPAPTVPNAPTVPTGPSVSATGAVTAQAPPPLEQRIVGKVYVTPKGNFIWTGQGWKPAI